MISREDYAFLHKLTVAVIEASRVRPGESVREHGPNITGNTLIRPGGRNCYPAFWIRDFAMSLECGLITQEEQLHALRLTAKHQAKQDWHTPSGSLVPKGGIADHINFDSKPIFFPGTMDYEKQGGEKWGYLPSLDDHFYFIEMAWRLAIPEQNKVLLKTPVDGISLIERLEAAFAVPPLDEEGLLVCCDEKNRGVSFGFTDAVEHTGNLLFCSLLRCRAAKHLADMFNLIGDAVEYQKYADLAMRISKRIPEVFFHEYGLLKASTGKSAQPDAWGSALAVYYDLVDKKASIGLSKKLAKAVEQKNIAWKGNIRHVPVDADFNDITAWAVSNPPKNTYQNGAYWGTPVGWVVYAVAQVDKKLASGLVKEYIQELREGDFRKGPEFGSPWECIHYENNYKQNPVYMTSVTCPLATFQRLQNSK